MLQLLDEMGDLSDGDLSVKAQVKDNIAGAIADSINYTIDNLRDLVVGINRATEQVTNATAVAQGTSATLLTAAETQSDQIMQTTDAVTDMTRSIMQVSQNAAQASEVAQRSLDAANQGAQAVQNTISGMNLKHSIIGIGLYVNQDNFPSSITVSAPSGAYSYDNNPYPLDDMPKVLFTILGGFIIFAGSVLLIKDN